MLLAGSPLVFTVGSLLDEGLLLVTAAEGLYLLSSLVFSGSVWLFAREFIRVDESGFMAADAGPPGTEPGFPATSGQADSEQRGFASATEGDDGE